MLRISQHPRRQRGDAPEHQCLNQLALPADVCAEVFATTGYSASITNLRQISLATDNVFSDGASLQTPTVTGNVTDGYVSTLTVPVAG